MALVPQLEHIAFEFTVLDYVLLGRTPYLRPLDMPAVKDIEIAGRSLETGRYLQTGTTCCNIFKRGERQLVLLARS